MMQTTLMNFGDNTRVVYDIQNKPCVIEIGQVIDADIADVHFHMIKRAVATDTLMVVPKDAKLSPKLEAILDILKSIETEPYPEVLEKFNVVAVAMREEHDDIPVQPSRNEIRRLLRDLAKYEVAKATQMTSKVVIREEGDDVTRGPREEPPAQKPNAIEEPPDRKDEAPRKAASKKRAPKPPAVPETKAKRERL